MDQSVTPSSLRLPPTSYHSSQTTSMAGAPMVRAHQADAREYPYGRPVQNQRGPALPFGITWTPSESFLSGPYELAGAMI